MRNMLNVIKQKLNSFAHFSIPVGVGKVEDGQNTVDTDLMVFSYKEILAGVYASEGVIKRIKQAEKFTSKDGFLVSALFLCPVT